MTDLMQQARDGFEAWATSQHLPIKRHRWGEYKVDDTEAAWEAWQAALRAAGVGLNELLGGGLQEQMTMVEPAGKEPIAWRSTTVAYKQYITDRQYRMLSPAARRWYEPYKCACCANKPPNAAVKPRREAASA